MEEEGTPIEAGDRPMKYNVDIDTLLDEFNQYQKTTVETWRENCDLKETIQSLNSQIEEQRAREDAVFREHEEMKTVMASLHELLDKRCDLNEENRQLHKLIESLKEKENESIKQHESTVENILAQSKATQSDLHEKMEQLRNDLTEQTDCEIAAIKLEVSEKIEEVKTLQAELRMLKDEHAAEILRLRLEYENKLQKMQKHAAKMNNAQNSTVNQEIYRKKLQHMKVESEREVSNLKRTINELQQELAMAKQGTNTSSLQGQNMLHFKTKRLRKN